MTDMAPLNLAPLSLLRDELVRLLSDSWSLSDFGGVIRLSRAIDCSPSQWAGLPNLEKYATRMEARGHRRGYDIVVDTINGVWEIVGLPEILPAQLFDMEEMESAGSVWDGEMSALAGLTLDWTVDVDLDLSKAIVTPVDLQLNVSWMATGIEALFASEPLSTLSRLIPVEGRRIFLALEGSAGPAVFGSITLATLGGLAEAQLPVDNARVPLPGEMRLAGLLSASHMLPITGALEQWPLASEALACAACATTWGGVASSWADGTLEFFGYKKVQFSLPEHWTSEEIANAIKLRIWAFGEVSPDRLLALRQIISLYNDPPYMFVDEILSSSETIYLGLRSTAVIEAVRDARDIESRAQQAVQQISQSSVDLAKSAGERVIAGLAAVGAAAIANVTQVLDAGVTTTILAFVGGYFVVMLIFFLLIDYRAIGLPIKQLSSESFVRSSFVAAEAVQKMESSPLVEAARALVVSVRISITSLYAVIVIALAVTVLFRSLS